MVELSFGECSTTRQTLMRYAAGAVERVLAEPVLAEPGAVKLSPRPSTITNTASVTGAGPAAKSVE